MNNKKRMSTMEFSLKSWKRHRRMILSIMILLTMSTTLLLVIRNIRFGIEYTLSENRKDVYGEWEAAVLDVSSEEYKCLSDNVVMEQVGIVKNYGEIGILDQSGDESEAENCHYMTSGFMDSVGFQLSRIDVYEGHLPEQAGEFAADTTTLLRCGIPEELGVEITVRIDTENGETEECSMVLVGILEDYQANWEVAADGSFPCIFLSEEEGMKVQEEHLLLMSVEGSLSVYDTIAGLLQGNSFVLNKNAYPNQYVYASGTLWMILQFVVSVLAVIWLSILLWIYINKKRDYYQYLYQLGTQKKQLYAYLLCECLAMWVIAQPIGIALGSLFSWWLIEGNHSFLTMELLYRFSWKSILIVEVLTLLTWIVGWCLACLRIRSILNEEQPKLKKINSGNVRFRKRCQMSDAGLMVRYMSDTRLVNIIMFLTLCVMILIPSVSTYVISSEYGTYQGEMIDAGGDYVIAGTSGIGQDVAERMEHIYGVSDVSAYVLNVPKSNVIFTADLREMESTSYCQDYISYLARENIYAEADRLPITVMLTQDEENLDLFMRETGMSSDQLEEFLGGEGGILICSGAGQEDLEKINEVYDIELQYLEGDTGSILVRNLSILAVVSDGKSLGITEEDGITLIASTELAEYFNVMEEAVSISRPGEYFCYSYEGEGSVTADMSSRLEDDYLRQYTEYQRHRGHVMTAEGTPVTLVNSDSQTLFERLVSNLDLGEITWEDYICGTNVILMLPPIINEWDDVWTSVYRDNWQESYSREELGLDSADSYLGQHLTLKKRDEFGNEFTAEVIVAGIITGMDNEDCAPPLDYEPFTVITGTDLLSVFGDRDWSYDYLSVWMTRGIGENAGDQEIRNLVRGLGDEVEFSDMKTYMDSRYDTVSTTIIVIILMNIFIVTFLVIIFIIMAGMRIEQQWNSMKKLYYLGLEQRRIMRIYRWENLILWLIAACSMPIMMFFYQNWLYNQRMQAALGEDAVWEWIPSMGIPVLWYAAIALLVLTLCIAVGYWPAKQRVRRLYQEEYAE